MKFFVLCVPLLLMLVHAIVAQMVCKANFNCPPGYTPVKRQCVDVDECAQGLCTDVHKDCVNLPGTYECNCTEGFEFSEDYGMCRLKSCEEGWERFGIHCYLHVTELKNWADAENDCVSKGAHLLSIQSLEEKHWFEAKVQEVMDALASRVSKGWHLGLIRDQAVWTKQTFAQWLTDKVEETLVWMDGEPYTGLPKPLEAYVDHDTGPLESNHTCVHIYSRSFYFDDCDSARARQTWCQKTKDGASCDPGWVEVGTECFYHDVEYRFLHESDLFCRQNNSHMAKIKTLEQLNAITPNEEEGVIALTSTLRSYDQVAADLGEVYSWTDGTSYKPDMLNFVRIATTQDYDYSVVFRHAFYYGNTEPVIGYTLGYTGHSFHYFCKKPL